LNTLHSFKINIPNKFGSQDVLTCGRRGKMFAKWNLTN